MKFINIWNCIGCWLTAVLAFAAWGEYHLHKTYDKMHDRPGHKPK